MAPKINQVKPDESTNNENLANEGINEIASLQKPSKLKTAVNNAIAKLWIALSLVGGNGAFNVVSLGTAGAIVVACEDPDDIGPEITKEVKEIPISGGEIFTITGNQVKVGNTVIQQFQDDVSKTNITISSSFDGSTISSGKPIDKSGRVTSIARDQAGNPSETARTHITKKETAEKPKYSLHIPEVTISQGDTVTRPQNGKEIFAGTQKIFAWDNDDYTFSTNIDLPYPVNNDIDVTFSLSIKGGQPETRTTKIKVNQVDNKQAPEVTREYPQDKVPNILGGVTVKGDNNQLTFGDVVMYTGKDDNTPVCTISLKLKGSDEEKVGKKISESNTYVLRYIDKDGKSSSPIEFPVKSESIDLTNLNLNMQVNQEVDLLGGINVPSGIEITKVEVEIDGQRQEVKAENGHYLYTPDQAGTCYIYVTEKGEFGNTYVEKSKNPLTIKALDYKEPTINTANIINEKYSWYNKLSQEVKDFIYPHLLASYAACNRSEQSNRVHIIMGETTNANGVENIGQRTDRSNHAKEGSHRIRVLCPDVSIKACHDLWGDLEKYIEQHPNEFFIISCAAGSGGGRSRNEFKSNQETAPEERLLKNERVIIVGSAGDWAELGWKMYNENIKDGNRYNPSSLNSKLNNIITVFGYVEGRSDNYFSPDATVYGGVKSAMPVGYKKSEGNLVMPMIGLIKSNGQSDYSTNSSYPTALASGVVGNAVSVVMSNNSGITPADAMTIIGDNYTNKKTFQYKDETTNGELVDGVDGYPIDMQKLLKNELLQSSKIDKLQFNKDEIELSYGPGICYIGKGVQFEYEGKRYSTTAANQSMLVQALKSGNIKFFWNKKLHVEQGGGNSVKIDVYVVDKDGNKFPDLHLVIERNIN